MSLESSALSNEQPPKSPVEHLAGALEHINDIPENRKDMPAKLAKRGIFRPERVYPGMPEDQLAQNARYEEAARQEADSEIAGVMGWIASLAPEEQQRLGEEYLSRQIGGTRDLDIRNTFYGRMKSNPVMKESPFYKVLEQALER